MRQLEFLDGKDLVASPPLVPVQPHELARRSDPSTSKRAAEAIVRSGKLSQQRQQVLELIERRPDSTPRELSDGNSELYYTICRRAPEMCRAGLIVVSGERDNARTYRATNPRSGR